MAKLAVIGLGPVGLVTATAFASQGHAVIGVEVDPDRRGRIADGEPPFFEPGLRTALRKVLRSKRLAVTGDMEDAVSRSTVLFLCVGTPSRPDGSMDERYLQEAAKELAVTRHDGVRKIAVVKSTVLPGTTERVVRPILESSGRPFGIAVSPEFLQEGRALQDALHPDRVVLGVDGAGTARALRSLYAKTRAPILVTDLRTAETIKYATNAFLATKVAFANELANLCDAFDVAYDDVIRGVRLDPRVNPRFLVPGVGFGGSCFPKDLRALVAAGSSGGYRPTLLESVLAQNDRQYLRAIEQLEKELGLLAGKRIALLGLSFKGHTDDVRESRAMPLARELLARGASVIGYDPLAMKNFAKIMPEVALAKSVEEALQGADGCILQADWPAFSKLTAKDFLKAMAQPVVVDGRRILNPRKMTGVRLRRIG